MDNMVTLPPPPKREGSKAALVVAAVAVVVVVALGVGVSIGRNGSDTPATGGGGTQSNTTCVDREAAASEANAGADDLMSVVASADAYDFAGMELGLRSSAGHADNLSAMFAGVDTYQSSGWSYIADELNAAADDVDTGSISGLTRATVHIQNANDTTNRLTERVSSGSINWC